MNKIVKKMRLKSMCRDNTHNDEIEIYECMLDAMNHKVLSNKNYKNIDALYAYIVTNIANDGVIGKNEIDIMKRVVEIVNRYSGNIKLSIANDKIITDCGDCIYKIEVRERSNKLLYYECIVIFNSVTGLEGLKRISYAMVSIIAKIKNQNIHRYKVEEIIGEYA